MLQKLGTLVLILAFTLTISACGSDKEAGSSTSLEVSPTAAAVTASPKAETTITPEPITTPQISTEVSAAPDVSATSTTVSSATPKAEESNAASAAVLFKQSCTSCHGVDLGGDIGPNLQKVGDRLTKEEITTQITDGGSQMPPFAKRLKANEIETIAAWLAAKK
jgi:mono/diheme cytochrome c family protein